LRSSFGHDSLGNSQPAVSQRSSNRCSNSCSWTRCVHVVISVSLINFTGISDFAFVLLLPH
jgi:hypothetical protein